MSTMYYDYDKLAYVIYDDRQILSKPCAPKYFGTDIALDAIQTLMRDWLESDEHTLESLYEAYYGGVM